MKTRPCHCCKGTGKELDAAAVGQQMRSLRIRKGISCRQMASLLGYSAPYISDLELGRRYWSADLITQYRDILRK